MLKRLVCATVVALVATFMVLPVQAEEVSPCGNCEKTVSMTTAPMLPQGESDGIQPIDDHTWGGDPDDGVDYSGWLDIYMCIAGYWDESCKHLLYHTIWFD